MGLWVDDLPAAVAAMTAQGVRFAPGGIRKGAAGTTSVSSTQGERGLPDWREGVLIELVQAPPEVIAALGAGA